MSVNLLTSVDIRLREWPRHHRTDGGGRSEALVIMTVLHQQAPLMYLEHNVCTEMKLAEGILALCQGRDVSRLNEKQ